MGVLDKISSPNDLKSLDLISLKELANELREEIIYTVSQKGGHLASSLGVVELTLALLKVFDPDKDKIIWDVGHQCYAYKILTRGVEKFRTLRQLGGISGFPKIKESKYDHFGVGHSSTSISAALGFVVARDLKNENFKVIAVIGDGSIAAGMAFEAMNNAGHLEKDITVILNDNEMSISKSVGALSSFLSRKLSKRTFVKLKEEIKHLIQKLPHIGEDLLKYAKKGEESLKILFTPGILFEALKFNYLGPIDGHNLKQLIQILEHVKYLKGPVLVHVLTKKGKGFKPAEDNPTLFHGVGPFDPKSGEVKKAKKLSYSKILGKTLCDLAEKDKKIIAITAAMPEGTGLSEFKDLYPERFFDVGICEQHAVTFAAGLALQGFKPVVCIYSTFLQRAYDQIIHDVCLQDLNVTFCIDRAGLVGEDGPTHHGQFDISYLRLIPNMVVMAPKDEQELQRMLKTAINYPHPTAIRYPRGSGPGKGLLNIEDIQPIEIGKAEVITKGDYGLVLALGNTVNTCKDAIEEERKKGRDWTLLNVRFVKPLPEEDISFWIENKGLKNVVIVEENALMGGFGSAVLEFLCEKGYIKELKMKRIGIPDKFIEHGNPEELRKLIGLDKENIIKILESF